MPKGTEPKTFEDLLDPKYKNKMAWNSTPSSSAGQGFVGTVLMEWGEARARAYFEKLSKGWSGALREAFKNIDNYRDPSSPDEASNIAARDIAAK